jgi:hypothetical protein
MRILLLSAAAAVLLAVGGAGVSAQAAPGTQALASPAQCATLSRHCVRCQRNCQRLAPQKRRTCLKECDCA